jgi:hypothetical protein
MGRSVFSSLTILIKVLIFDNMKKQTHCSLTKDSGSFFRGHFYIVIGGQICSTFSIIQAHYILVFNSKGTLHHRYISILETEILGIVLRLKIATSPTKKSDPQPL